MRHLITLAVIWLLLTLPSFADQAAPTSAPPRLLTTVYSGSQPVGAVAYSTDGKLLASSGADGTVKLWEISWHA